ncbi:HIT family protein [Candidatus Woesearchaeota archaeon]|nr:HIT family protein [Candidatus Woesearchaeota archaeon]
MGCDYCDIVDRNSRAQILYEDDTALVVVKDLVLIPGQITILPRQHFTILELVPDEIVRKCSVLASKVSQAVFDSLEPQGTNILVHNGLGGGQKVPHFAIEIIPRREGDGLNLQWPPKEVTEEELEMVVQQLEPEVKKLGDLTQIKPEEPQQKKKEETKSEVKEQKENYLTKSLRRIP